MPPFLLLCYFRPIFSSIAIFLTSFPAPPLNIFYLIISLNTDLTMLCSQKINLWYLLNTHTLHPPPPPSSLSLSNCSVGFSKSSKVWSLPNVHPTPYSLPCWPTCRSWSNHLDLLCFQTHSESFCWCLCLSYSLVLEGPSSHYLPVKFNSYLTSLKVNNKTQKLSKFHYSKLISVYYYSTLQYSILQCFVTVQSFH